MAKITFPEKVSGEMGFPSMSLMVGRSARVVMAMGVEDVA